MRNTLPIFLLVTLIMPGLAFASKLEPGSMEELWLACWNSAYETRGDVTLRAISRSYCAGVLTGFAASIDKHDSEICLPAKWNPATLFQDAVEQLSIQEKAKFNTSLKEGLNLIFAGAYPCN